MKIEKLNSVLSETFAGNVAAFVSNGVLILNGELDRWDDIVKAGVLAAKNDRRYHVVNKIKFTGGSIPPMRTPKIKDNTLDGARPDVLVIGAGIVGCAIARELSKWDIDVLLVDKEHDVAVHASSRNDGMVHPGIDLKNGQKKHKYNLAGNRMYDGICEELSVPFKRAGQYLTFKGGFIRPFLYLTHLYWRSIGIEGARVLGRRELLAAEPELSSDVKCALYFPTAGIVCPYGLTIAYAENAVSNGVRLSLDTAVTGMELSGGAVVSVTTNRGVVYPKIVINAAGVFAEDIAVMARDHFFSIHPRRGSSVILDKKVKHIVNTIYSGLDTKVKSTHSKGGGVVSTVHGNVLVGPNAVEIFDKEDFSTRAPDIAAVIEKQQKNSPGLSHRDVIAYFTGVRAATYEEDFVIEAGRFTENIIHAAGIQSPGLTAAPAIALEIERLITEKLSKAGELRKNEHYNPCREAIIHVSALDDSERAALIERNPDYGEIVCRCEEVSRGEVLDALRRPVPCDTLDGVKRRVRPGSGRCQGGFCSPLILQIIAEEKDIPLSEVKKAGEGSEILQGVSPKGG